MLNLPWRLPVPMRRELVTLGMLTGLAAVLLIGVTALSELFHSQQDALGERWSSRGAADLAAGSYKDAENDYRTALRYERDGYSQQLGLAEALIGRRQIDQASVYLENLWDEQPENGVVNRELARIAAGKQDTRSALRYYHNAIYATWSGNAEAEREATRWELIKYLLNIKALAQVQSELIGLGAEVGDNPVEQLSLGQYFLKVQDGEQALAAFQLCLHTFPRNGAALAGAGEAAFDLGNYPLAQHYLSEAIQRNPADKNSASLLEVTSEVTRLDPFRPEISDAERDQAVLSAFQTAGERLKDCPALASLPQSPANPAVTEAILPAAQGKHGVLGTIAEALGKLQGAKAKRQSLARTPQKQPQSPAKGTAAVQTLAAAWAQLEPKVTVRELRHNQDVVNEAMNLAFNIERQAALRCNDSSTAADTALLLISRSHEGS